MSGRASVPRRRTAGTRALQEAVCSSRGSRNCRPSTADLNLSVCTAVRWTPGKSSVRVTSIRFVPSFLSLVGHIITGVLYIIFFRLTPHKLLNKYFILPIDKTNKICYLIVIKFSYIAYRNFQIAGKRVSPMW